MDVGRCGRGKLRILSRPEVVKGRRGRRKPRWVQVPEFLMELLHESVPPDDKGRDTPIHPAAGHGEAGTDRRRGHGTRLQASGHPSLQPHDLRHRRISLWHHEGIPARTIGDRVGQRQSPRLLTLIHT